MKDSTLDMRTNPNKTTENDFCVIDLVNETITWKPGMFNPKLQKNINYWFNYRKLNPLK